MMKKPAMLLMSMVMIFTMAMPVFAEPQAFDWKALENNYYTGTSPFMVNGKAMAKSEIKNVNSNVDYSIAVERFELKYSLINPEDQGNKAKFINEYKSGTSLRNMSVSTGEYYTPYKDENGIGTAIVKKDGTFGQAFIGDSGKTYKLDFTETLKNGLTKSNLERSKTQIYSLIIAWVCSGVLFTDGTAEYYYVQDSAFDSIKKNALYAAQDLVSIIEKDDTIVPEPPAAVSYTKDGLAIPETGGGAASVLKPDNSVALIIAVICFALFALAGFAFIILNRKASNKK